MVEAWGTDHLFGELHGVATEKIAATCHSVDTVCYIRRKN